MKPVKSRELFEKIEDNSELVSDLIEFFYRKVRSTLSELIFTRIFVQNLGTFYIKERALKKEKAKCLRILVSYEKREPGIRTDAILKKVRDQLTCIAELESIVEKRNQDRKFLKLHRKNYYENKTKVTDSLEGEVENTGSLV